ncbi:MAG: hypothetical protein K1Y02_04385 [Candidatus Hydrogenedentes bacterium]|nr:hypothetical protein [Candidatus Hydrogenedentota bacterium]
MISHRAFLLVFLSISTTAMAWDNPDLHPRPDWSRPYVNLNGSWRFDFDSNDAGVKEAWFEKHDYTKTINVPYPWQSKLSGIQAVDYNGVAWYERDITIPADAGPRVFVVFGAIDWKATVYANGKELVTHEGGYVPFEVELTDVAKPGENVRLTVRVEDRSEADLPTGKQVHWYTQTGGIWQTVYLESRGTAFLRQTHVYPDIDNAKAGFEVSVIAPKDGSYTLSVTASRDGQTQSAKQKIACKTGENLANVTLAIANPALWSPDSPNLYDAVIELLQNGKVVDSAKTYFGMRKVSRGTYGGSEYEYILLNNKPIYLRGALHQSFNPDGIHTHPDDAYIRRDYEKTKDLGLNFLRIHIKTEEPRALYWADKLGVLIMSDVPNWWTKSDRSRGAWEATMRGQIARDFNHPAVFSWCLFNETWGIGDKGYDKDTQNWVAEKYHEAKKLDPTRLIEDNSACNYDHVISDINSWHFYTDNVQDAKDNIDQIVAKTFPGSDYNYAKGWKQDTAPLINSEYGGVSAGSGDRDISWVFLFLTNLLRKHNKICGYVYTELEDIEWEHNGYMNYDRSDKVFAYPAGIKVADLQGAEYPVLDCPPYQAVNPGDKVSVPILLSHWSEDTGLTLRISAAGKSTDGQEWSASIAPVERPVTDAKPFTVSPQGTFDFVAPKNNGLISVVAEVLKDGKRIGANYCVVHVKNSPIWNAPGLYCASFPVDAFSEYTFAAPGAIPPKNTSKTFGYKNGSVAYRLKMPSDLKVDAIQECRLVAELGAQAEDERKDWPQRKHPQDYPQTDGKAWPTDIAITVNGVEIKTVSVDNDFADAEGIMSHVAGFHHGSHGQVFDIRIEGAALDALKASLKKKKPVELRFEVKSDAAHVGGLAIYGANMGSYPADPALLFQLKPGATVPSKQPEIVDSQVNSVIEIVKRGPDGHVWQYTTTDPGADWNQPSFDDRNWQSAPAGFGTKGTPGALVGTEWNTPNIWLRTEVSIPKDFANRPIWLDLHHDEDAQVYINGQLLVERKGYTSSYERIVLSEGKRALFKAGQKNVIAVHCSQTAGGQFVDLSLSTVGKVRRK